MSTKTPHEIAFNFYSEGNYKELINFITPYVKTKDSQDEWEEFRHLAPEKFWRVREVYWESIKSADNISLDALLPFLDSQ